MHEYKLTLRIRFGGKFIRITGTGEKDITITFAFLKRCRTSEISLSENKNSSISGTRTVSIKHHNGFYTMIIREKQSD
ncbi:hypothetical protein PRUPE_3G293700 [Prunus persica]|uniref:Uncharacterized protein n=1 Tax=Prunus persica TaxID=3760 RepID=M5WX78_PRUPE|nr:hypothetical protein PRUPE_3G293700 [Prunus persica]